MMLKRPALKSDGANHLSTHSDRINVWQVDCAGDQTVSFLIRTDGKLPDTRFANLEATLSKEKVLV